MTDAPERPRDDPARSWDDEAVASTAVDGESPSAQPETVGTGSYVAVSCVAGMGFLLLVLIAGLLLSRWLG